MPPSHHRRPRNAHAAADAQRQVQADNDAEVDAYIDRVEGADRAFDADMARGAKSSEATGVSAEFRARCSRPGVAGTFYLADLEFHWLAHDAPICQIYAVRLNSDDNAYNAYVFHKPLAPDWESLIREHGVERAPWDDPAVAVSFEQAFLGLVRSLDEGAVLVFKGASGSDVSRLARQTRALPDAARERVLAAVKRKGVLFLSVDAIWKELCNILPPFLRRRVFTAKGGLARKLSTVWDQLFWHPILVHIPQSADGAYDQPDVVARVDTKLGHHLRDRFGEALDDLYTVRPVEERTVFLSAQHYQPAWHTAHTDTLATRSVLTFLLTFAEFYSHIEFISQNDFDNTFDSGLLSLSLLATTVVQQTKWFREKTLYPTAQGVLFCRWVALAQSKPLIDVLEVDAAAAAAAVAAVAAPRRRRPGLAAAALVAAPASFDNASSVVKGRERRLKTRETVKVFHDDELVKVYRPVERGQDAIKVRALKQLVAAVDPFAGASIYDRLEMDRHQQHGAAVDRIGDRPWYYYPAATGRLYPGYQVLHSRRCLDRKNGHDHGLEPPWDKDNLTYYDFDKLGETGAPGYKLQFCKACKMYTEGVPPPGRVAPAPAPAPNDDIALLILLTVTLAL